MSITEAGTGQPRARPTSSLDLSPLESSVWWVVFPLDHGTSPRTGVRGDHGHSEAGLNPYTASP